MALLYRISHGIRRNPRRFFEMVFTSYGVTLSCLEAIDRAFPDTGCGTLHCIFVSFVICLFLGAIFVRLPLKMSYRIGGGNTKITVKFGDIFEEKGLRVIPVNEFFDSELGAHVSSQTLHGKVIEKLYGGSSDGFYSDIAAKLAKLPFEEVPRDSGRTKCYPLGTTTLVGLKSDAYLLLAFARTDIVTKKAYASVQDMWTSLGGLWETARVECHGSPVVLPLLGSGQSGVGLSPQQLLVVILTSAFAETKKLRITKEIVVVLDERFLGDIDLPSLSPLIA